MLASRRAALLLLLLRLRLGHMHLGRAGSRLGLSLLAAAALEKQDDKHTPSYSRPFFCCTCTWYLQPVLELTPLGHLAPAGLPLPVMDFEKTPPSPDFRPGGTRKKLIPQPNDKTRFIFNFFI